MFSINTMSLYRIEGLLSPSGMGSGQSCSKCINISPDNNSNAKGDESGAGRIEAVKKQQIISTQNASIVFQTYDRLGNVVAYIQMKEPAPQPSETPDSNLPN